MIAGLGLDEGILVGDKFSGVVEVVESLGEFAGRLAFVPCRIGDLSGDIFNIVGNCSGHCFFDFRYDGGEREFGIAVRDSRLKVVDNGRDLFGRIVFG